LSARNNLLRCLKILVSLGLIVFLIWKISPGKLLPYLKDIDPLYMAAAVLVFILSSTLGAFQWFVLLSRSGVDLRFSMVLKLYFVGLFFNNFLPANVGGDAVKIFDVSRMGNDPYRVFAITLLDRIFGITGLCVIALAASLALLPAGVIENLKLYILLFASLVGGIAVFMLNRPLARLVRRIFTGIRLWNIGERLEVILDQLGNLRNIRPLIARVTVLTLVIQFLRIFTHLMVGKAIGIDLNTTVALSFFLFVPVLGLVMTLPISLNGLGLREGTGILLFASVGIGTERALLVEFLTYVVMVAVSLSGGLVFLRRHIRDR